VALEVAAGSAEDVIGAGLAATRGGVVVGDGMKGAVRGAGDTVEGSWAGVGEYVERRVVGAGNVAGVPAAIVPVGVVAFVGAVAVVVIEEDGGEVRSTVTIVGEDDAG